MGKWKRAGGMVLLCGALAMAWGAPASAAERGARRYPDVLKVVVRPSGAGAYRFDVTISSPDTGWKKYADAFRVRTPEGAVLGTRILYHPHVNEQPFTRSLLGVRVPPGVKEVIVEGRDSVEGWGGKTRRAAIPSR